MSPTRLQMARNLTLLTELTGPEHPREEESWVIQARGRSRTWAQGGIWVTLLTKVTKVMNYAVLRTFAPFGRFSALSAIP